MVKSYCTTVEPVLIAKCSITASFFVFFQYALITIASALLLYYAHVEYTRPQYLKSAMHTKDTEIQSLLRMQLKPVLRIRYIIVVIVLTNW